MSEGFGDDARRAASLFFAGTVFVLAAGAGAGACAKGEAGGSPDASMIDVDAGAGSRDATAVPDVVATDAISADVALPPTSDGDVAALADAASMDASSAIADTGNANDATGGCEEGEILCGSSCVNPATDPSHCGGCGTVCATGICGTTLAADMSAAPPNWTFNGTAAWSAAGPSAVMTQAKTHNVAGTVVYNHPIVTAGFVASFQFRIGANGGGQWDGMGFMLETEGPTALGAPGAGLGMSGLDGFGVELDIYNNNGCGDSNANHVGIDQLTSCGSGELTSLYASGDLGSMLNLFDAQWHTAVVNLLGGTITVTIDGNSVVSSFLLSQFVSGTSYYFGFAGGIGGSSGSLGEIGRAHV